MPRKNRAYKKGEPHRDARLFVIVAEGEREDQYFGWFNERNQRIQVRLVPREEHRSAPNHFLERVNHFAKETGWSPEDSDQLWFVLDVDQWERAAINNLIEAVGQEANWHIAISNPCFEVWILYHVLSIIPEDNQQCVDLKRQVHREILGGFHVDRVCPLLEIARRNAEAADTSTGDYPNRLQSKTYLLAKEMLSVLGNKWG